MTNVDNQRIYVAIIRTSRSGCHWFVGVNTGKLRTLHKELPKS